MGRVNWINVSGGKDSTALLLWSLEEELPNCRYVSADTKHENPITYAYLDYLEGKTGVTIERVGSIGFRQMAMNHGMFPTKPRRFCTEELKVWPLARHMARHEESDGDNPHMIFIGVRREESPSRATLTDTSYKIVKYQKDGHKKGDRKGASFQLLHHPILDLYTQDVFDIHRKHGVDPNPLYKMGMQRVGCFPCIMAKHGELKQMFKRFPETVDMIREMEAAVNLTSKEGRATFFPEDKSPKGVPSDIDSLAGYLDDGDTFPGFEDDEPGGCYSVHAGLCE